jgi:hypothetical protein
MVERLYTDADVEAVARVLDGRLREQRGVPPSVDLWHATRAVLDALTAPGSPLVARIRAQAGEDVAAAIADNPGPDPSPASPTWWAGWIEGRDDGASIARKVTRTEEPT